MNVRDEYRLILGHECSVSGTLIYFKIISVVLKNDGLRVNAEKKFSDHQLAESNPMVLVSCYYKMDLVCESEPIRFRMSQGNADRIEILVEAP
jgi:hypothetical protein